MNYSTNCSFCSIFRHEANEAAKYRIQRSTFYGIYWWPSANDTSNLSYVELVSQIQRRRMSLTKKRKELHNNLLTQYSKDTWLNQTHLFRCGGIGEYLSLLHKKYLFWRMRNCSCHKFLFWYVTNCAFMFWHDFNVLAGEMRFQSICFDSLQ